MTSAGRAVLVTSHYIHSRRRAGSHWIAEALRRAGIHVTFVTVGFSQLSRLKRDHRFQYDIRRDAGQLVAEAADLDRYVWFTPFHPLNRLPGPLAWAATPLFERYAALPMPGVEPAVREAEILIFESTPGLMLLDRFRAMNPRARLVYRVTDDLESLRAHPVLKRAEDQGLPVFDLVSVPSQGLFEKHRALNPRTTLHNHGIEKALFDERSDSPYDDSKVNAVFVGTAFLDRRFIRVAAAARPNWEFHLVGPLPEFPGVPNIRTYGEMPFAKTVPFITHANIGLATLRPMPNAHVFSDSLKVIQYTYARLPILMPDFIPSGRPNVIPYPPGDPDAISRALTRAVELDRASISRDGILSWDELAAALVGDRWPTSTSSSPS